MQLSPLPGRLLSRFLLTLFALSLTSGALTTSIRAQGGLADELAHAYEQYRLADFQQALQASQNLLNRGDLSAPDSIAIFELMSLCAYAQGEENRNRAFEYLNRMAGIGPCINRLPQEFWPRELMDRWYRILQAKNVLNCPSELSGNVRTIAISPFDNLSTAEYVESLGMLSHALAGFFCHDFGKFSELHVVERTKMDYLLGEQGLGKKGITDQATAVKVGKMLGAQLMVFGIISQIDKKTVRMTARAVNVETSEIIASVDTLGKPEYCKLEKALAEALARELSVKVDDNKLELLQQGGTDSQDALEQYAYGIRYMDRYNYKRAYEYFKKAYEIDPDFAEAKEKMETYRPLAG